MADREISTKGTNDGHLVSQKVIKQSDYKEELTLLQAWLDGEYPNGWYQSWHMIDNTSTSRGSMAFCFSGTIATGTLPIAEPLIVRLKCTTDPKIWRVTIYRRGGIEPINLLQEFNKRKL